MTMDKILPWPADDRQHCEDAYREVLARTFKDADWKINSEEILGDFGFRVLWGVSHTWANVAAFLIEHYDGDDEHGWVPMFEREGEPIGPRAEHGHLTRHVYEAEPYLDGYVKWDGCLELDQGRPHWCGPHHVKRHMALLEYIYKRAMELMDSNEDPWDE